MRDATDKSVHSDEAASERNKVIKNSPSEKTAGGKSSSKLAQFFRPSFLAAASLAENTTLLALLTSRLQHVSIQDTYTTLSGKKYFVKIF